MPKLLKNNHLEGLEDRFNVLFHQENKYACTNYLYDDNEVLVVDNMKSSLPGVTVDEHCRKVMANWCYKVTSHWNFGPEIACIAMHLLDRFLSTEQGKQLLYNTSTFQLATVCCLHITIKLHETRNDISSLSKLCRGFYNSNDFNQMEGIILSSLKWNLCPPTPYSFLELFLDLLPHPCELSEQQHSMLRELVHKQIIASIQDYKFVAINPSLIAVSSLLNAFEHMKIFPYDLQVSFLHNIYVVTGLDCTNHHISNLKKYLICSTNMQYHQSNNPSSSYDSSNATNPIYDREDSVTVTRSLHSPVCVVGIDE